jgi:hypothetical protein
LIPEPEKNMNWKVIEMNVQDEIIVEPNKVTKLLDMNHPSISAIEKEIVMQEKIIKACLYPIGSY